MTIFTAKLWIVFLVFVIGVIVITPVIRELAEEKRKKKQAQLEFQRRKATISGITKLPKTEQWKQKILYNLDVIRMPRPVFVVMEVGCFLLGLGAGKFLLTRIELALALAAVATAVPIVFISVRSSWYKQYEAAMLENCMVMITGAYRSTKDIIKAVRDNADKPNMPIAFKKFLSEVTYVDSNVEKALLKVAASFNNKYFTEWIEVLIKAQYDSNMMDILPVIVDEMNAAKKAQNESSATMKAVWKEYILWVVTMVCVPLILKINDEWHNALVNTPVGKTLTIALLLGLLNTMRVMVKISKPIDI